MLTVTSETPEFKSFLLGCESISDSYCDRHKYPRADFTIKEGPKFIKVIQGISVHCFVQKSNGDVLKAASWQAPAKHARGNIFDADNGLKLMGEYGPAYLR